MASLYDSNWQMKLNSIGPWTLESGCDREKKAKQKTGGENEIEAKLDGAIVRTLTIP